MPIEITDTDSGIGNIILGSGIITGGQYINAMTAHLSQDESKLIRYKYSLCDFSKTAEAGVTIDNIEHIVKLCRKAADINTDAVVALVGEKDGVFNLAKTWQFLFGDSNWEVQVFRSRENAEAWIKARIQEKHGIDDLSFS